MMHYDVETLASNDHAELESLISEWLRVTRPERIIKCQFVADGAEYTYCVLFIYIPRTKPLPGGKSFRKKLFGLFLSCFSWR